MENKGSIAAASMARLLTTFIVALVSVQLTTAAGPGTGGDVLAQMTPGTADGWSLAYANGLTPTFTLSASGAGVSASDTADTHTSWYFVGPPAFSGDMKGAYNGKLSFNIVHMAVADAQAKKELKEPLVILQAMCGHSLWWSSGKQTSDQTTVMLNEDAGWVDSRTGKAAGVLDMLGVLSHLSHIKIRGGFFKTSAETTRLSSVQVVASGKSWFPCCTLTNEVCLLPLRIHTHMHIYIPVA